jgi:cell division protein FtsZ
LGLHEVNEACSIIREAAECDDVQINFGVILNEAMDDAVKVTVIATGFTPETARPVERRSSTPEIRVHVRLPEPEPEPQPIAEPEPEPAVMVEADPVLDMDDLDTPAYLRQGRLLN